MNATGQAVMCGMVSLAFSSAAFGAGFEKAIMFSGRYAGVGNAVTSWVDDSQALYFNPAGLAAAKGWNVSLNFSPTWSQFKGPIYAPDQVIEGDRTFSPVAGGFASYNPSGRLGAGIGAYVSGGTKAIYTDVDFSALGFTSLKPTIQSDLIVIEYSAGAGYEPVDGLRLGAAFRLIQVSAKLGTVKIGTGPPATLTEIQLSDLSDTGTGFRLGVQYAPEDATWGIGAAFRSEVAFEATGKSGGSILAVPPGGEPAPLTEGDATVRNVFPLQALFGIHYDVTPSVRVALDYDYARYSENSVLDLEGSVTLPAAFGGTEVPLSDITQNWEDQHNVRVGAQYTGSAGWTLSAGYILTSKVPPEEFARATFSSPGFGHSFIVGAGRKLPNSHFRIDLAGEYSFATGTVTDEQPITGKYSSEAFIAHIGVTYAR